jgi:hypothetical protein
MHYELTHTAKSDVFTSLPTSFIPVVSYQSQIV